MGEVGISVLLDGNLIQASGLARFTFIPTGKEYLVYSLNEKTVQNGKELEKIYVSETGEGGAQLSSIGDNDKSNIKPVLSALSSSTAELPNNIQLGVLSAKQYTVGPYYKIAVETQMKNGILATQLAKQPAENSEIAAPSTNQFITVPEEPTQDVVQEQQTVVQNAFNMSAPEPEQTAPTTLISEPVTTPVETVPAQEVIAAPQPVQLVVQEPVVQQVVVPNQTVDINQSVKEIINYSNGDVNKVIDLFKTNGMDLNINTQVVQPVAQEVVTPVATPVVNPSIDINNLPVADQPVEEPKEELNEESFVPSTPSLPVDDNQSSTMVETPIATTQVVQEPVVQPTTIVQAPTVPVTQVVQPVAAETTVPVQSVTQTIVQEPIVPVQEVVQPIFQEPVVQQTTIVQEPTIPVTQVVQPVAAEPTVPAQQIAQAPVAQPTQIVQTAVQEPVLTTIVQEPITQEVNNQNTAQITQDMQNSTVNFNIPEEPAETVENNNISGIPTIVPLTAEDLQPQTPSESPIGVEPTKQEQHAENDKSFLDAAGPVVMPIGQEQTNAVGYPGDSGQN